jgi:hypothetical protein
MSGYTEDRIVDQGGLGVRNTFIAKPLRRRDLLRSVRMTLDRATSQPPPGPVVSPP